MEKVRVFGASESAEYEQWLEAHPAGYVVNQRQRRPMLHYASCGHIYPPRRGYEPPTATPKVVSENREAIEQWADEHSLKLDRCSTCRVK